jgi:hypothetical protein
LAPWFIFHFTVVAASAAPDTELVDRYLKYTAFPRLSQKKAPMEKQLRFLCVEPPDYRPSVQSGREPGWGPHFQAWTQVYANPVAITAGEKSASLGRFPVGSIFVKEKYDAIDAKAPTLITVMEKISARQSVDDWKFTMIRLSDHSVVTPTGKVSCAGCHDEYRERDFISSATTALLAEYVRKQSTHR